MTEAARFAREEMDVLADAAEVRIVVLGDEGDAKWSLRDSAATRGSVAAGVRSRPREIVTSALESGMSSGKSGDRNAER